MKFLDLFSGIGGFRLGLEQHGHECIGFCEIDKYARQSYKAIHNTEGELEYHDITTVTDDQWRELKGTVDIIAGGFPCQAFSIAGKRQGFEDETRGTLFFEIMRAAKQIQPPILFLENVKGLLNHDKGRTFRIILQAMDELGYDAEWQVLNSKDFGVPQNRERVFIIGHLRGACGREIFPIGGENGETDTQIIQVAQLNTATRDNSNRFRTYDPTGIAACLSTMGGGGLEPCVKVVNQGVLEPKIIDDQGRLKESYKQHDVVPTLRAQTHGNPPKLYDGYRIRKLTPLECWRLQGFPDSVFRKAEQVVSNNQLYKQAGNSVTVNVIAAIAEKLTESNPIQR